MAVHRLVLYPARLDTPAVDHGCLVSTLRSIGLLAAPLCGKPSPGYRAGKRFLELITFLGCSPAVTLDPPVHPGECEQACARGSLCYIRIAATTGAPRFRADGGLPAPRCPRCRHPEPGWADLITQWRADPRQDRWSCNECGYDGRLTDLNFRNRGAFSRSFIDICGIHPAEAVPGETLLETLREIAGGRWKYMYLKD